VGKGQVNTVRRVGLVLVAMAVTLVVGGGIALAAVKFGTDGRDFLTGINRDCERVYDRTGRGDTLIRS
jgi:hypothetical protein